MGAAFSGISTMASYLPHGAVLGHIAHASGTLELGSRPTLDVHFEPTASISAATLADELGAVVSDLKIFTFVLPDRYGEKTALSAMAMTPVADAVTTHVDWPYDSLDRAVSDLARLLSLGDAPWTSALRPSRRLRGSPGSRHVRSANPRGVRRQKCRTVAQPLH